MVKLLEKVDEMVNQRKSLEKVLRESILADDITKVIAGKGGTQDREVRFQYYCLIQRQLNKVFI